MSIREGIRRLLFGDPGPATPVAVTPKMVDVWFVKIPEWMRQALIDESGSVRASLSIWTRANRVRMAEINCIGVEFDPTGDREIFPWLISEDQGAENQQEHQQDTERAWWQAIA